MIVVSGVLNDEVTELVCARIEHLKYEYIFFDQAKYPESTGVDWSIKKDGAIEGVFRTEDREVPFESVTGIYLRMMDCKPKIPESPAESYNPYIFDEQFFSLSLLFDRIPCLVVNRLAPQQSNAAKPYQTMIIKKSGFEIPKTIVTNDPGEVRNFYECCGGRVIFKSISSVRSIVNFLDNEYMERLPLLQNAPCQFQEFIPGCNIRIHTVGSEIFATRIITDAVDYRYASKTGELLNMEPYELPDKIKSMCFELSGKLGLVMAGIDCKLTPEGQWYCFEVNPSPGFIFYERFTLQPISEALANLLKNGDSKFLFGADTDVEKYPNGPNILYS